MKIVFVLEHIRNIGGLDKIFAEKINYFADVLNYEVFLVTSTQHGFPFIFEISSKVKCIDLNVDTYICYKYKYPKRILVKWKERNHYLQCLQEVVESISPDIVVGCLGFMAMKICRLRTSAKIVIESHAARSHMVERGRNILRQTFDRIVFQRECRLVERYSDYIVVLTNGDRKEWSVDDEKKGDTQYD